MRIHRVLTFQVEEMKFDPQSGRWSGEWTFVSPGWHRSVRPLRHYVYTLEQWRCMFRAAGLWLTGVWSGYAQPYRAGRSSPPRRRLRSRSS